MRRGWLWLMAIVGLLARVGLLALLFWGTHPLWLMGFWRLQGYPTTLSDLSRWYALGAFNTLPILAWLIAGLLLMVMLKGLNTRLSRRWMVMLGALSGACMVPPLAYVLLLMYAGVWHYRAWDAMLPTLLHAYFILAPSSMLVGACAGWLSSPRTAPRAC